MIEPALADSGRQASALVGARTSPAARFRRHSVAATKIVLAATIALLLIPVYPSSGGSVTAATLLVRAATSPSQSLASSGTAEWISHAGTEDLVPPKAAGDLGMMRIDTTWAIADATHFRIQTTTSSPALQTQSSIYAANGGTSVVWYRDIDAIAIRMPLPKNSTAGATQFLTSGGALPPLGGTIGDYVDRYNRLGNGIHARLVGQESYLGRTADVVEVQPLYTTSGTSCPTNPQNKQHCSTRKTRRYGSERIWVDHQHLMILQVQVRDIPAQFGGNSTYRVTSVTFGVQPSPQELAFTSPIPVTDALNGSNVSANGSGSSQGPIGGNAGWRAPIGFISAGRPTGPDGTLYTSSGSGQGGSPGGGAIESASVIFARNHSTLHGPAKNFVLVQEQVRKNGAPPLFSTGTTALAGTCRAVTGSFPDGIHWLGFSRDAVYVLISSDSLTQSNLVQYVATEMCR